MKTLPKQLIGAIALAACTLVATGCSTSGTAHATGSENEPEVATLGMLAPDFSLTDVDGNQHRLSDYTRDGKLVVLEWFNPDCPYTKAYHAPERRMVGYYESCADKDVVWLAINSGAPGKQGAGLERNVLAKSEYEVTYPILMDEDGTVGRLYEARSTPHMFVIDAGGMLIYDGAIDNDSGLGEGSVNYVLQAMNEYWAGNAVSSSKTEPYGCGVKYGS